MSNTVIPNYPFQRICATTAIPVYAITSVDTNYVAGASCNVNGGDTITVIPIVDTTGGGTATFKAQFSIDGVFWVDYTVDSVGAPAAGEVLITQNSDTRAVDCSVAGAKTLNGVTYSVRAPFFRLLQKSSAAVSLTVRYHLAER